MANFNVNATGNITVEVTSQIAHLETTEKIDIMMVIHSLIGSVGILANLIVIVVLVNHVKFRQKIPNIFIIHQVRVIMLNVLKLRIVLKMKRKIVWCLYSFSKTLNNDRQN